MCGSTMGFFKVYFILISFCAFFRGVCFLPGVFTTPLDDYVNLPDPTFNWTLKTIKKSPSFTAYVKIF
jgi:hypothetical protein